MTGRDLIIYILENNLEDVTIFNENSFNHRALGLMNIVEAAAHFHVGESTIRVWIGEGLLKGIRIGQAVYFTKNTPDPRTSRGEKNAR